MWSKINNYKKKASLPLHWIFYSSDSWLLRIFFLFLSCRGISLLSSTTGRSRKRHGQWHLLALWWAAFHLETSQQPAITPSSVHRMAKSCYQAIIPGVGVCIWVLLYRLSVLPPHRTGTADPRHVSWLLTLIKTFFQCQMCEGKKNYNGQQ